MFALIGSAAGEGAETSDLYRDGSWEERSVSPALAGAVQLLLDREQTRPGM